LRALIDKAMDRLELGRLDAPLLAIVYPADDQRCVPPFSIPSPDNVFCVHRHVLCALTKAAAVFDV
jgi:hypothetical protein